MAPGDKLGPQFYADDRVMMVIYSGQVRRTVDGQEPVVAGPGFLVNVPYRTTYSLEAVGDQPVVRFEVNGPNRLPFYPTTQASTDKPADPRGFRMTKISWSAPAAASTTPIPTAPATPAPGSTSTRRSWRAAAAAAPSSPKTATS